MHAAILAAALAAARRPLVRDRRRLLGDVARRLPRLTMQEGAAGVRLGRRDHAPELFAELAELLGQDSQLRLDVVFVFPGAHARLENMQK